MMASRYSTPVRSLVAQDAAQFVRRKCQAQIVPIDAQDQSAGTLDHMAPGILETTGVHIFSEPALVRHQNDLPDRP